MEGVDANMQPALSPSFTVLHYRSVTFLGFVGMEQLSQTAGDLLPSL